ncbi:hypothetical protein C8J56DRAFT_263895 [Mycena floridula]|nr:hypothetical protein C8J56DRAFT_263895 [Mycena floridula]
MKSNRMDSSAPLQVQNRLLPQISSPPSEQEDSNGDPSSPDLHHSKGIPPGRCKEFDSSSLSQLSLFPTPGTPAESPPTEAEALTRFKTSKPFIFLKAGEDPSPTAAKEPANQHPERLVFMHDQVWNYTSEFDEASVIDSAAEMDSALFIFPGQGHYLSVSQPDYDTFIRHSSPSSPSQQVQPPTKPKMVPKPPSIDQLQLPDPPVPEYHFPADSEADWFPHELLSASLNSPAVSDFKYPVPSAEQLQVYNGVINLLERVQSSQYGPKVVQPHKAPVVDYLDDLQRALRNGAKSLVRNHEVVCLGGLRNHIHNLDGDPSTPIVIAFHVSANPPNLCKEFSTYDLGDMVNSLQTEEPVFGMLDEDKVMQSFRRAYPDFETRSNASKKATKTYRDVLPSSTTDKCRFLAGTGRSNQNMMSRWADSPFSYHVNNQASHINAIIEKAIISQPPNSSTAIFDVNAVRSEMLAGEAYQFYSSGPQMCNLMNTAGYRIAIMSLPSPKVPKVPMLYPEKRERADRNLAQAINFFVLNFTPAVTQKLQKLANLQILAEAFNDELIPVHDDLPPELLPPESFKDFNFDTTYALGAVRKVAKSLADNATNDYQVFDSSSADAIHNFFQFVFRLAYICVSLASRIAQCSQHQSLTPELVRLNYSVTCRALDVISFFAKSHLAEIYMFVQQDNLRARFECVRKMLISDHHTRGGAAYLKKLIATFEATKKISEEGIKKGSPIVNSCIADVLQQGASLPVSHLKDAEAELNLMLDDISQARVLGFRKPVLSSARIFQRYLDDESFLETKRSIAYLQYMDPMGAWNLYTSKIVQTALDLSFKYQGRQVKFGYVMNGSTWDCGRSLSAYSTVKALNAFPIDTRHREKFETHLAGCFTSNPQRASTLFKDEKQLDKKKANEKRKETETVKEKEKETVKEKETETHSLEYWLEDASTSVAPSGDTRQAPASLANPADLSFRTTQNGTTLVASVSNGSKHCEVLAFLNALIRHLVSCGCQGWDETEAAKFSKQWCFGVSKLCCPACAEFFRSFNIGIPGGHSRIFMMPFPHNIPLPNFLRIFTHFSNILVSALENVASGHRTTAVTDEAMSSDNQASIDDQRYGDKYRNVALIREDVSQDDSDTEYQESSYFLDLATHRGPGPAASARLSSWFQEVARHSD